MVQLRALPAPPSAPALVPTPGHESPRSLARAIRDHAGHLPVASIGEVLVPESVLHHTYALLGLLPGWQRQCFGALSWQVYVSGQPLETLYPLDIGRLSEQLPAGHTLGGLFLKRSGVVVTSTALARRPLTLFHELAHGLDLVLSLLLGLHDSAGRPVACSQTPTFARVYAACKHTPHLRAYVRSSPLQLFAEGLALRSYDPELLAKVALLQDYMETLTRDVQEALAL